MARTRGNKLVLGGLLLIAAALCLVGFNVSEQLSAGRASAEIGQELEAEIPEPDERQAGQGAEEGADGNETVPIDGEDYLGVLSIPSLSLELPVNDRYDESSLKETPCRYEGSLKADDLIIAGHSYPQHFGHLRELRSGDEVSFRTASGATVRYRVSAIETLAGTDVEGMEQGDWDLTLFTCTPDSASRITVRCKEMAEG